jgi:ADP-ribosylglycohydrolase
MHDVLDDRDLVPDEAEQLSHSGYPAEGLLTLARAAAATDDRPALARLERDLAALRRAPDWPYEEPSDLAELNALAAEAPRFAAAGDYEDRVAGAWTGRCVANTLGKPVEGLSRREVEIYLKSAGQWPLRGYLPLLDPLPDGVEALHWSAPASTAGNFTAIPRDDDLDWTVLGLKLLERHGRGLTTEIIAAEWLDSLPFTQTFTAERAAYRNLVDGVAAARAAEVRNPYREWIGALIRADIFGFVNPGDLGQAAAMALTDATLSHRMNGLYGESWAAALTAAAFGGVTAREAIEAANSVVPEGSRLHQALRRTVALRREGITANQALDWVDQELGHYNWVHTVVNAAVISISLLWGTSFLDAVGIAVRAGRDTDSTAATVGSVYGALHGSAAPPVELIDPASARLRSSVAGFDGIELTELVRRTVQVRERIA